MSERSVRVEKGSAQRRKIREEEEDQKRSRERKIDRKRWIEAERKDGGKGKLASVK
jgi:hypothetical protein